MSKERNIPCELKSSASTRSENKQRKEDLLDTVSIPIGQFHILVTWYSSISLLNASGSGNNRIPKC